MFQKEKDAALTPLRQNPGWGLHRQAGRQHRPASLYGPIVTRVTPPVPLAQGAVRTEVAALRAGMAFACLAQPKVAACCLKGELSTVPAAVAGWPRAMGLRDGDRGLGPHSRWEG